MDHHIETYSFGHIRIDEIDYEHDVIITPEGITPHWWRKVGHEVSIFDLAEGLALRPRRLIIGTGAEGACRVLGEVEAYCAAQGIELIAVPTPEAVAEFNTLEDSSQTVCALHLTC
jgi:hypothetical protein